MPSLLAPVQLAIGTLSLAFNFAFQRQLSAPAAASLSLPLPLDSLFNARAASSGPLAACDEGFDGRGGSYPADDNCLPQGNWFDAGVEFHLAHNWGSQHDDHILASGQTIPLREPVDVSALHLLVAGDFYDGDSQEAVTVVFEDGTEHDVAFAVKDWWSIHWLNKAPIKCAFHWTPSGANWNTTHIHHVAVPLTRPFSHPPSSSTSPLRVKALSLPTAREKGQNRLHIFALTLATPAKLPTDDASIQPALHIQSARTSSRWTFLSDGRKAQSISLVLENRASGALITDPRAWLRSRLTLTLDGLPSGFELAAPGPAGRLMPADEREIEILVAPVSGSAHDRVGVVKWSGSVRVRGTYDDGSTLDLGTVQVEGPLVGDWHAFYQDPNVDLDFHGTPRWFDDAKFGIFIHFGLFSVPAWTDRGRYAEWYWYWLHEDASSRSSTWQHHRNKYGEDFAYDDFIPAFTGAKFDADKWVQLISEAGAKYFVLTTKHHDGFALFDTQHTSDRSSVKLAPGGRDYVRELFDAADRHGGLKKGTYFSMPEWYSPSYASYGWERFPGGLPPDVFHPGNHEPYTGWHAVDDYVEDLQREQMRILGEMGSDIMWCDIGGANHSSAFLSDWYSCTSSQGRQVTTNNRCGVAPDFDTPEYERFATVQSRKWETCEGIDPFSFGYNSATRDDEYRSSEELIHNLIDITSKNGAYLLNIGPTGEGAIVDVMQTRLREVGAWLKVHGEAIYETVPFPLLPELVNEHLNLRFTRTLGSFYILSLRPPIAAKFRIPASLPILTGDRITLLGPDGERPIAWSYDSQKVLVLHVLEEALQGPQAAAYVFKVSESV